MNFNKFTIKAQEAVQSMQNIAQESGHQQVEVEHLLLALLEQEKGIIVPLIGKLGIATQPLKQSLNEELKRRPKVSGAIQVYLSPQLNRVFNRSFKEAERLKDDFVSCEHLLLSLFEEKESLYRLIRCRPE